MTATPGGGARRRIATMATAAAAAMGRPWRGAPHTVVRRAIPFYVDARMNKIERALSVPRIGAKGNRSEPAEIVQKLAGLQAQMLKDSTWVGDDFARQARAMADGEAPQATIHGQATLGQAKELHEEGIKVMPQPFPVVPPEQQN